MPLSFNTFGANIGFTDTFDYPGSAGKPALTGSAWVNVTVGAAFESKMLFDFSVNSGSASRFQWQQQASGANDRYHRIGGRANDGEGFQSLAGDPEGIYAEGEWHHLVAILDYANDEILAYMDGVLEDSDLAAGWTGVASGGSGSNDAYIGRDAGSVSQQFDGLIDDVRLYGRRLSLAEIQTIYAARGHDNIIDGLSDRWTLNQLAIGESSTGQTEHSIAGLGWPGVMNGDGDLFPDSGILSGYRRRAS